MSEVSDSKISPTLIRLSVRKVSILSSETIVCCMAQVMTIITLKWPIQSCSESRSGSRSGERSEPCVRNSIS